MSLKLLKIITGLILILADTRRGTNSLEVRPFIPKPEIPAECLDKEYCEYVPNYPKKYAASLIAKLQERGAVDLFRRTISIQENDEHLTLCPYDRKIVTPQAARDSNGEWHFILNQKTYPLQQYQAIECRQQQTPKTSHKAAMNCGDDYMFMVGATPTCQQKNATVELTTFDDLGRASSKYFSFPCCCSCEAATGLV